MRHIQQYTFRNMKALLTERMDAQFIPLIDHRRPENFFPARAELQMVEGELDTVTPSWKMMLW